MKFDIDLLSNQRKPMNKSKNTYFSLLILFNIIFQSPNAHATRVEKLTTEEFGKKLPALIEDIKTTAAYSWGVVGTPAATSPAENAARILYKNADEKTILNLLPSATLEGQMYLMCILRKKYPSFYKVTKKKIVFTQMDEVSIFTGDILSKKSVFNVIRQIEKYNCSALDW
jgi:hypothetical protein